VTIDLIASIIENGMLKVDKHSSVAYITPELKKLVEHEEMLNIEAPICSV
jgi:hypothetical protein